MYCGVNARDDFGRTMGTRLFGHNRGLARLYVRGLAHCQQDRGYVRVGAITFVAIFWGPGHVGCGQLIRGYTRQTYVETNTTICAFVIVGLDKVFFTIYREGYLCFTHLFAQSYVI